LIQSKFYTDKDPQILGTTVQKFVTWTPLAYSEVWRQIKIHSSNTVYGACGGTVG